MSSTEFNVGLANDRSSSRVLKPPGGGHSNIFGAGEEEKPKGKARRQTNEISNCFQFSEYTEKAKPVEVFVEKEETDNKHVVAQVEEEEKKTEPKAQPTPQRVRVPPGGFSSGLW